MAATPATYFTDQMVSLTGNTGGGVQALPPVNLYGGKNRSFVTRLVLNSQTSGAAIAIARVPLFSVLLGITVLTDTSLGSSTLAFGDAGNGNSALFSAAATYTATNTKNQALIKQAVFGAQINQGYDSVSGLATNYATGASAAPPANGGGALYEDIQATIAVANLPASGTAVFVVDVLID